MEEKIVSDGVVWRRAQQQLGRGESVEAMEHSIRPGR
jgi:hypothetical protein